MHDLKVFGFLMLTLCVHHIHSQDSCESNPDANITSYRYKNYPTVNCGCDVRTKCLRKCCSVGFYASKGVCKRYNSSSYEFKFPVYTGKTEYVKDVGFTTNFLVGVMNCSFFPLKGENPNDKIYVQENNRVWVPTYNRFYRSQHICVDDLENRGLAAFICGNATEAIGEQINVIGMIISMPFLIATFIVYALLPERNLHMKALMFYVMHLCLAYITLVSIQLSKALDEVSCQTLAYFCLFFFTSSIIWMNIICIDIWVAFSGIKGFHGDKRSAERKRFLIYLAYGLSMPLLLVLTIVLINEYGNPDKWYHPGVGGGQCFLKDGHPYLIYFHGPMAILIAVNVTLFTKTALTIRSAKRETSVLKKGESKKHSDETDKQKFNLYLKLLLAMGINWSFEIISWAVITYVRDVPKYVWYVTDFCNAIYGVFIFFLFVFKKKIWNLLKKRYYIFIGKPQLAHMTSQQTRTTSYSTTDVSLQENHQNGNRESHRLTKM